MSRFDAAAGWRHLAAVAIVAALVAAPACTHDHTLRLARVDELRAVQGDGVVEIELKDGRTLSGVLLSGVGTTLLFQASDQMIPRRLELAEVAAVSARRRMRGGVEGLLLGGAGGVLAGAALGAMSGAGDEDCAGFCSAGERALQYGIFGSLGGGIVGALVGYAAGSRDRHQLELIAGPAE